MRLMNKIKVAIDSPAAAGAGTQAKLISKHFNLFYLDTGKIYRLIANIKITQPKKYNHALIKKKMNSTIVCTCNVIFLILTFFFFIQCIL